MFFFSYLRETLNLNWLVAQGIRVLLSCKGKAAYQGVSLASKYLDLLRGRFMEATGTLKARVSESYECVSHHSVEGRYKKKLPKTVGAQTRNISAPNKKATLSKNNDIPHSVLAPTFLVFEKSFPSYLIRTTELVTFVARNSNSQNSLFARYCPDARAPSHTSRVAYNELLPRVRHTEVNTFAVADDTVPARSQDTAAAAAPLAD